MDISIIGIVYQFVCTKNNNKPNEDAPVLEPVETILNIEEEPLTIDDEKPSLPPLDFVNEVESSTVLKLLKNLKRLKKRKTI